MSNHASRADFLMSGGWLVFAFAAPSKKHGETRSESNPFGNKRYPNVGSWLALDSDGDVTIYFGKVEQGTGIQTAVSQLVAEELDVRFDRIRVVQGDTDSTPDQGYTAGSQSLSVGAVPVRKAAAQARRTLIAEAASRLNVAPETLETRDGAVVSKSDTTVRLPYGHLVRTGRFPGSFSDDIVMKPTSSYQIIGKPIRRVDVPGKLDGSFLYVQNVKLAGMLHARMVHPERLGLTALQIDPSSLGAIQSRVNIVHHGGFVAVASEREWDAVSAARTLRVQWSGGHVLPANDRVDGLLRSTPGSQRIILQSGDVSPSTSDRVLRATYHWPFQSHGSIGPSCGVADVTNELITIWSGTEGTHFLRRSIAKLLHRSESTVVIKYVEGSGAYGHNGADDAAAAAAVISAAVGRPVRMQWMRMDETRWDPKGPAMLIDLEASVDASGHVHTWSFHGFSPTHERRPDGTAGSLLAGNLMGHPAPPPSFLGGDRDAKTNYVFANQRVVVTDLPNPPIRQSSLRGLGGTANIFANESFIDELALAAKSNPIDFRLSYLNDPRARAVLEQLRTVYRPDRGLAFVQYENNAAYVAAVVDLRVDRASGIVRLNHVWVAHDCGLIVNPDGLRNQIEGCVIQGASRALLERVTFTPDGVSSVDWETYPIMRFSEVPSIDIELINRPDKPIFGAGEATTTVMAPAIANALFAQTAARLRDVPFSPDRVKSAMAKPSDV